MIYDVILSRRENKYLARIKQWPDVVAEEKTREAAIQQVKQRLYEYLAEQVEVVQIEVDLPNTQHNPWITNFGRFKTDPTFGDLQERIEAYRQDIDTAAIL